MQYRNKTGERQRESTGTEDWDEAQRIRERLQARDNNTLPSLRRGRELTFGEWADLYLENFSKPPFRAQKTHEVNERAMKHLNSMFQEGRLGELTADDIEAYLRERLKQRVQFRTGSGFVEKGQLKAATVHQEFRVLRRMLNVAVPKKFLAANPCSAVEFPTRVDGRFRPHYMSWSEQQVIEFSAPEYLKNVIQIVTETGLRIYKELAPLRKEQLDLENGIVWIPDSKTVNGVAEVPLTGIAIEAFRRQLAFSGSSPYLFPRENNPEEHQRSFKTTWHGTLRRAGVPYFSDLRPEVHVRYAAERRRGCGRIRDPVAEAGRREGLQEILPNEAADEAGGTVQAEPERERKREGF